MLNGIEMTKHWEHLRTLALDEVEATLGALPGPLRERARQVAVILEPVPGAGLQADGIAEDTLGLFVGPDFADEEAVPMPPQIMLFLDNLWEQAERDEDLFVDEVCTTYLHELGHYLGLDEEDLEDRGLE